MSNRTQIDNNIFLYSFNLKDTDNTLLLLNGYCIPYIPELGERVGVLAAVFLQQIHYWSQKGRIRRYHDKIWVHNTYEEWANQLKCSVSAIRKIVHKLEHQGFINTLALNARVGDTTKWYSVNYDAFKKLGLGESFGLNQDGSLLTLKLSSLNDNSHENQPLKQHLREKNKEDQRLLQSNTSLNKTKKIINNLSPAKAESIFNQMILIWNETIHQGSRPVALTESRLKRIKRRFMLEFNGCLDKWKEFCTLIGENDFLMGTGKRGWKATLDWALEPQNIKKVLNGFYIKWIHEPKKDDAHIIPQKSKEEIEQETRTTEESLKKSSHPKFWQHVCVNLIKTLGIAKFKSWVENLVPIDTSLQGKKTISIKAPTRFMRDWVETNLSKAILQACQVINPRVTKVELVF